MSTFYFVLFLLIPVYFDDPFIALLSIFSVPKGRIAKEGIQITYCLRKLRDSVDASGETPSDVCKIYFLPLMMFVGGDLLFGRYGIR